MEFGDVFFNRASLREGLEFGYGRANRVDGGENLFKVFNELVECSKGDWLLSHSLLKVVGDPGLSNSFLHMRKGENNPFVIIVIDLLVNKDIGPDRI